MASKSILWSIIWFLVLIFIGFWVAGFCAGWYILIMPFTVCIDGLKVRFLSTSWDRCYDFLNIFAEKFSEKIGVFDSKQSQILKTNDHNIGI
jgi:hypothetical protein